MEDSSTRLGEVLQVATLLAASAEPEDVFESLVHRCARSVCEAATATVSRRGGRLYATTWRAGSLADRSLPDDVVVDLDAPSAGDYAGYHIRVSFRFGRDVESGPFIAQLLVERAAAVVERERLGEAVRTWKAAADRFEHALTLGRQLGVAVGILMVDHDLTEDEALDLLSRLAQHRDRGLREIVLEVVQAGEIQLPLDVPLTETDTRHRLTSVPSPRQG